jgi:hypothetical protein
MLKNNHIPGLSRMDYPCSELPFTLERDKVELSSEPETRLNTLGLRKQINAQGLGRILFLLQDAPIDKSGVVD